MTHILNAMKREIAYCSFSGVARALPDSRIKSTGTRSITTAAIIACIVVVYTTVVASASEAVTDAENAQLTQIQIDALETPDASHPLLEISPTDSEFSILVKRMTSVVVGQLKHRGVLMDFQPAEEIARLIQQGAQNILAKNSSEDSIEDAETKIKQLADSIVTNGDHVIGAKSTTKTDASGEVVQVHRSAFDTAKRLFCPCWPFCN
jgi:hypothetical protein